MGFALVIAGLLMIVTGARGTYAQFAAQVAKDFTGPPGQNFTYFIVAIGAIGAVGYIEALRTISRLMMVLVIIVIFLSDKGFFAQFQSAMKSGPVAPQAPGGSSSVSTGQTSTAPVQSQSTQTPGFVQSLKKPGGGGFWDWIGIPSPFGQ